MKKLAIVALVLFCASFASAAITDSLVLHAAYNEASGSVTLDSSGNGNDGVIFYGNGTLGQGNGTAPVNAPRIAGKFGNALDMSNRYVGGLSDTLIDTHMINTTTSSNWTYSFWTKRPTTAFWGWGAGYELSGNVTGATAGDETTVNWWGAAGNTTAPGVIAVGQYGSQQGGVPSGGRGIRLSNADNTVNTLDDYGFTFQGPGGAWGGSDVWHNIIQVKVGSSITTYIDGVEAAQTSAVGAFGNPAVNALGLGGFDTLTGNNTNQAYDDYGVWNRALTEEEIGWIQSNEIPEPATMTMLGLGVLSLIRRKK